MKKIFKYAACCMAALSLVACGDLYETHEKYLQMGEEVYIGFADSLQANGGFKRIELKWKLNADPRIDKCVITWNGNEQPVEMEADYTGDFMSKILDMPEGKYIFTVVVKSETGKESLIKTVSGESYGDNYQLRLPQRGVNSMSAIPAGVTINWAPEEGCVGVSLTYTNNEGTKKTIKIGADETSTLITDFVPGSEFTLATLFKPELYAIDEIESVPSTMRFPAYYTVSKSDWDKTYHALYTDVNRTGWTIEATTEELTGEVTADKPTNGQAVAILDGKLNTFWHSQWSNNAKPPLPHLLTIDMQKEQDIISIELARREDNKDTKDVVFSISNDNVNWTELGVLNFPNDNAPNAKILLLPEAVKGRYFRAAVTSSNNGVNASIAEIMFTSGKK